MALVAVPFARRPIHVDLVALKCTAPYEQPCVPCGALAYQRPRLIRSSPCATDRSEASTRTVVRREMHRRAENVACARLSHSTAARLVSRPWASSMDCARVFPPATIFAARSVVDPARSLSWVIRQDRTRHAPLFFRVAASPAQAAQWETGFRCVAKFLRGSSVAEAPLHSHSSC